MPNTSDTYKEQLLKQQQDNAAIAEQHKAQGDAIEQQLTALPGYDSQKAWQDYQTGGKPMLEAIMSNYQKPVPTLTPEQQEKAKYGAAITDTMSTLAEMFAHGQGSLVRNRANDPTSTQTTNAKLQALNDKYKNDLMQYNHINANVQLQDWGQARQDAKYESEKSYNNLFAQLKQARAAETAARKDAATAQQHGVDYAFKSKELDNSNKRLSIEQQKANKEKSDKFTGLVINAHPSDPNAVTDATGNRIVPYKMTKPEIDNLAMTAKNDAEFMKNHPELLIDKPDMFGTPHKGLTTDQEIANAYAQEKYNSKFAPAATSTPAPTNAATWKLPVIPTQAAPTKGPKKQGKTISNF